MTTACADCRHWYRDATETKLEEGECRERPPVPVQTKFEVQAKFPITKEDDYCGRFAAKENT